MDNEIEKMIEQIRERYEPRKRPTNKGHGTLWIVAVLLLVVIVASVAAGLVSLFQHSLPPVSGAILTTPCPGNQIINQNVPPTSGTGNVLFTCSNGNAPIQSTGGSVMPSISGLTAGQTLALTNHVVGATTCTGTITLVSGSFVVVSNGAYDYCLQAVGNPTPTVTVSWSQ